MCILFVNKNNKNNDCKQNCDLLMNKIDLKIELFVGSERNAE